ncbi:hypothetical protein SAMN05444487_10595 [Marininema mesophilum]|uniref:YtpI-like protein n=1 Tax=Marininema mesophilum TaxID=1048340 RepID=A0A1H2VH24_9BACL|nr:hypothetical protein [Marininema mesophilum]SDW67214.1 hypothetical protein SAMN05444487_10595 [Marininema mesophilum]
MTWISDFFTQLVGAFARLVTAGFIVWMTFVIIIFFKELFTPGDIRVREYLYRVWRRWLLSFELTSYGGIVVALYYLFKGGEEADPLLYSLILVFAILGSWFFIRLRIRSSLRKKKRDAENPEG